MDTSRYKSTFGFIDLLFNLLVGFTFLFMLAFILINPVAKKETLDPKAEYLIIMTWEDYSSSDIDLWIKDISPIYKNVELHIFGSNIFFNEYNVKKLKLKKIFFRGRVSKQVLKNTYNKSMAMICLGYDETFCLNALEANSCGLPIITFGKTALNNFVTDDHNGFVARNYTDLTLVIVKMINISKSKHLKLIKNSINTSKKYLLKNIINNWLNILK